ncbi:MAG: alpha/beta hydrolase [Bryobacterales bacterium]|nr:alpha/beta hydrolase [Bryobacterales bacterium]
MSFQKLGLVLVLLTALLGRANAASPPGMPTGWTDGYVYANGIRIHYYHAVPAPGKPVIVMAHGATDYGLNWTTLTLEMQSEYDIYMVDARGHGYTDPPTADTRDDAAVEDLAGFIRAMKLEKPILMGHSMGSGTAMRIGAAYPDLPRAVILLDPGLGAAAPGAGAARGAAAGAAAAEAPTLVMRGTPEALVAQNNRSYDELLAQCRKQTPKWDLLDCQYWAVSKRIYHGSYATGGPGTGGSAAYTSVLGKITAPTLILKADAPPETRRANEAAAKVLKNGKLVHIDGAGHNLHHDERQQTLKVLREFLRAL